VRASLSSETPFHDVLSRQFSLPELSEIFSVLTDTIFLLREKISWGLRDLYGPLKTFIDITRLHKTQISPAKIRCPEFSRP
jgi:hypothetical protein